jgi:hypothetical protein
MAVHGLDNIVREQWRNVRPRIRNFTIDAKPVVRARTARRPGSPRGWSSEATGPDGKPFKRPGRATFILARREGRWMCVHSHVSLQPTQSEAAHGKPGGPPDTSHPALERSSGGAGAGPWPTRAMACGGSPPSDDESGDAFRRRRDAASSSSIKASPAAGHGQDTAAHRAGVPLRHEHQGPLRRGVESVDRS